MAREGTYVAETRRPVMTSRFVASTSVSALRRTSAQSSSNASYDTEFGGPGYFGETLVSSIHATTDGGIDFTTGGSLDDNAAIFSDFLPRDHLGVVDTRALGSWQYHAFPILP